jgi:hypothetical protein
VQILSNVRGTSTLTVSAEHATVTGLPQTATNGETVSFTVTAETGYILDSVKLGNTELTATEGAYSFTVAGDAVVTIATHEEGGVAVKTAVVSYTGSSTGNMDGTNQASLFGLDATKFSIVGTKNDSNNNIGLNKDGTFRLYQAAENKIPCKITITGLTGVTISSIAVTYGAVSGKTMGTFTVVSGADNSVVTEETGGIYAVTGNTVSMFNSKTSSSQVGVSQIVITYTEA